MISIIPAYVWALVSMAFFFIIAMIVASAIPYKPNNPGTTARRVWFWILLIVSMISGFMTNFIIYLGIRVPSDQSRYLLHASIAMGVFCVLYILLGLILSKIFSNSKIGTLF